jgi:superfamily II DNA or RNA helicase
MDIVLRRYGNIIDFGVDAVGETPRQIVDLLTPHLSYRYTQILRGAAAYDVTTGERRGARQETRYLFQVIKGRLTTHAGHIQRAADVLRAAGHTPRYLDVTPPLKRPRAYEPHWEALRNEMASRRLSWRARQDECLAAIVNAVANRRGGVISAPTGFGKTTMIILLGLLFPFAKIDVVVRSTNIMSRIMRSLLKVFPNVGQIGDGRDDTGRITLVSADSLHKVTGDADFVLLDEVHALMNDRYSALLGEHYMFALPFGFSATPYSRMDGCSARVHGFCGQMLFHMTYQEGVALGLVVPISVDWLRIAMDYDPCGNYRDVPKKRFGIWRNEARNHMLAEAVRKAADDEQVLMLVESVEHAVYLGQYLPEFVLCYGSMKYDDHRQYQHLGLLPSDYNPLDRKQLIRIQEDFEKGILKKAIATDVWSTGVDFEQLSILARCDDRDSDILDAQGPGRVSRLYEGKSEGRVIDCIDYFNKGLYGKSCGRRKSYRALGWGENWPVGNRNISSGGPNG